MLFSTVRTITGRGSGEDNGSLEELRQGTIISQYQLEISIDSLNRLQTHRKYAAKPPQPLRRGRRACSLTETDHWTITLLQRPWTRQLRHSRGGNGHRRRIQHRDSRQGSRCNPQWYASSPNPVAQKSRKLTKCNAVDQAITYICAQPDAH